MHVSVPPASRASCHVRPDTARLGHVRSRLTVMVHCK